jgi:hypothetical protein
MLQEYAQRLGRVPRGRALFDLNESNWANPLRQWTRGAKLSQGKYIWIAESMTTSEKGAPVRVP